MAASYRLWVFDYNYSSWSMRAGVVMRLSGVTFDEERLDLDDPGCARARQVSPSGLLPVLEHGDLRVWDSLAIAEYMAEQCPNIALWPRDGHARAQARAASCEMHAGYSSLRQGMPMNIRARYSGQARTPEVERDVARIKNRWAEMRARFGGGGPFLCGAFGIVDAMFAPVILRFRTYDVGLEGVCKEYADAVLDHGAVRDWLGKAEQEEHRVPRYDYIVG